MKRISYLLMLTLISAALVACGGGGGSSSPVANNGGGTNSIAPTITSAAPQVATEGQLYTYTATTGGSAPQSFFWNNLPSWLSANGATISGTPAAAHIGTQGPITLTVTNGTLPNANQTFSIQVIAAGGNGGVETAFLLTDAPVDELSVFQIEVTKIDIEDTSNNT
ncbi:MAG: hypothetical protein KDB07_13150, partial [Planctomycetes bacterium]|nr:hypothetical protein [Planctomycetota bacterium]